MTTIAVHADDRDAPLRQETLDRVEQTDLLSRLSRERLFGDAR
jgi:hypothetical protein